MMIITYTLPDKNKAQGSYWDRGPAIRGFKGEIWVISDDGVFTLVGQKFGSKSGELFQIIEIQPGKHLGINANGDAYCS